MKFRFPKIKLDKRILIFLAIMGPGIITAFADNDAGGIATYSVAGAHFGYSLLWMLLLITISLAIVQEMCARMGAVTGKGLSDLIREEFGLKWTLFAMIVLFVANIANIIANFAGIAASLEIFGITKYVSIPLAASILWFLIIKGSYKSIERTFLIFCSIQFVYIIAGFLANPDWGLAFKSTFVPSFQMDTNYIAVLIGIIGTTITPWMQFFIQSSIIDKGITIKHYKYERNEIFIGAFLTDFIAFFIIIASAATLFKYGIMIETAKDAALALEPIAGKYCQMLFALGFFGASILGASIIPISLSYAICEAFGWENGLNKKFKEAPIFYWLFTGLIIVSAITVLIPRIPLIHIILLSQELNGILLPIILIFMMLLINNKKLMGKYVNTKVYNFIAWLTVGTLIVLTTLLFFSSFIAK